MPELAYLTIYAFSIGSITMAVYYLLNPQALFKLLGVPVEAGTVAVLLPRLRQSLVVAIAVAAYWFLTASARNQVVIVQSVAWRAIMASNYLMVLGNTRLALWEGGSAALTALALVLQPLEGSC